MYQVYILKSINHNYSYIGTTDNIQRRFKDHNDGKSRSTKPWRPFILIHKENYQTLSEARKREWFLKCTPQGGKEKRKIFAMAGVAAQRA